MTDKPKNIKEYQKWSAKTLGHKMTDSKTNYVKGAIQHAKSEFLKSDFWVLFIDNLQNYNQEYYTKTDYYLYKSNYIPEVLTKPFESIESKCFRKNILLNKRFPKEPYKGWYNPLDCFARMNDLIRTSIVVKYLDGIEFIIDKLKDTAESLGLEFRVHFEARETGYYAVHTYLKQPIEIPKIDWDTVVETFSIEIQITTELQENIKKLTHKYYSERRDVENNSKEKWQWKYESDEFSVNYLGHILHYLEGQIMEIRNKK